MFRLSHELMPAAMARTIAKENVIARVRDAIDKAVAVGAMFVEVPYSWLEAANVAQALINECYRWGDAEELGMARITWGGDSE